jgi:cardiolipin synthase
MDMRQSIPNWLTYSRILVIPAVVATFYLPDKWGYWVPAWLFLYACITDYLDGYLARMWSVSSSLGRFLDPVADKLLVATCLMLLVSENRAHIIPAIAILCREILVSGLREFLAELRISVPVTTLAKYKTAAQMLAIGILLLGNGLTLSLYPEIPPDRVASDPLSELMFWIGNVLLWLAAILTLVTGYAYFREGVKHLRN